MGLGFRVGTGVGEGLKLRHSTVAPTHTFRLRLGGLGFRVGTGGEGLKLRHSTVAPTHTFRLRLGGTGV